MNGDYKNIMKEMSDKCIACGFCVYVCPSWNAHGQVEYFSPRARSLIVRGMLEGHVDTKEAVESIFTCNTCKRCLLECPTGVDVAEMVIYAREFINKNIKI